MHENRRNERTSQPPCSRPIHRKVRYCTLPEKGDRRQITSAHHHLDQKVRRDPRIRHSPYQEDQRRGREAPSSKRLRRRRSDSRFRKTRRGNDEYEFQSVNAIRQFGASDSSVSICVRYDGKLSPYAMTKFSHVARRGANHWARSPTVDHPYGNDDENDSDRIRRYVDPSQTSFLDQNLRNL